MSKSPNTSHSNSNLKDIQTNKNTFFNGMHSMHSDSYDNTISSDLTDNHVVKKTKDHPLGDLFLSILSYSKNDIDANDVIKVCEKVMNYVKFTSTETKQNNDQILESIQKDRFDNHLVNRGSINENIKCPKFSPTNALDVEGAAKQNILHLIRYSFPSKKFSGQNYPTIIEYLTQMNSAQELCNLSEKEFKQRLVSTLQGEPYDLVRNYISMGMSINDIYNQLICLYHNEMTPENALAELVKYKSFKGQTLAEIQSQILKLCIRASFLQPERNRKDFINTNSATYLIRALPHDSKQLSKQLILEMSKDNENTAPTFQQFMTSLSRYSDIINRDISLYGQSKHRNQPVHNYEFNDQ